MNCKYNNMYRFLLALLFLPIFSYAQVDSLATKEPVSAKESMAKVDSLAVKKPADKKWYDRFEIRGYLQVRYNELLQTNEDLTCEQCDRFWGGDGGFGLRRARVVFSGQISNNIYFYIQPDFASAVSDTRQNFVQLRDAYFDIGLDQYNEYRFRIGQSKVPYGFENMQSSQNRIPLDRDDALNSAFSNERDMGVSFFWAPKEKRELFSSLVKEGLKGSGDYGIFAFGVYNGQTANNYERNDNSHIVSRITYPFEFKNQIIEASLQGYTGKYEILESSISPGVKTNADRNYTDERLAASFVLYPKPFGIQAEYNIGEGPEYNSATDSIEVQSLKGGYITASYLQRIKKQVLIPFVRYQYYDGGKKHERDARSYNVDELEIGTEWQLNKYFELVVNYTISKRRFEDGLNPDNDQEGNLLRIQAQLNF